LPQSLAAADSRYVLAGIEIFDRISGYRHQLDRDSSGNRLRLVCTGNEANTRAAREVLRAGAALVRAGGLRVEVQNSALTHPGESWLEFDRRDDTLSLYSAWVRFAVLPGAFGSCGMHAFGLADTYVPASLGLVEASNAISAFNLGQLQPATTAVGTTPAGGHKPLQARHGPCRYFSADQPTFNPYGVWTLSE
jgi:hypothetical protein